ncbi:MAG: PilZ domain-containing protein [Gammaproteobacteria bacterium]
MGKPIFHDFCQPSGRKHPRASCQWNGRIQNMKRQVLPVKVRNISLGGVGVLCPVNVKKGEKVFLECRAISGEKCCDIRAICEVAFVVFKTPEYDLGLQFSSDMDKFRDFIAEFVNARTLGI